MRSLLPALLFAVAFIPSIAGAQYYGNPFGDGDHDADDHPCFMPPPYTDTDQGCTTVNFGPQDATQAQVTLQSQSYMNMPYCNAGIVMWNRLPAGQSSRSVQMQLQGRGSMLPWEQDSFQVCLDGNNLNANVLQGSYQYSLRWQGDLLIAQAGQKLRTAPDPSGLVVTGLSFDAASGNFVLALQDRWSSYYQSEQVQIDVELKHDRKGWFDKSVVKKQVTLPVGDAYAIRFADFAKDMKHPPEKGKDYFVRWRFQRMGPLSTNDWQPYFQTPKAVFGEPGAPAPAAVPAGQDAAPASGGSCFYRQLANNQCTYLCLDGTTFNLPAAAASDDSVPCAQTANPPQN